MMTLDGIKVDNSDSINDLGMSYGSQLQLNTRLVFEMLLLDDVVLYVPNSYTIL